VYTEHYWIAATLVVIGMLLLELKTALEDLAKRTPPTEILTFTKFLLLSVVILPVLPNSEFTAFNINPFKTWLVVVAISGLSYMSYILHRVLATRGTQGSTLALAMVGGGYSSTVATIALANRSKDQKLPHLFSGATLAASGVMYFRLAVLLSIFSTALRTRLALPLCVLGTIATVSGILWTRRSDKNANHAHGRHEPKNPLEMSAALLFAALFLTMQVLTGFVLTHLGDIGLYFLSFITGVTDVDPFVMGLTQSAGISTPATVAAIAVLIAAASNNVIKGVYALMFSERATGRMSFIFLSLLAAIGLVPVIFLLRNG
jgi:uncharacterized membrane protein (DUF4010 family)